MENNYIAELSKDKGKIFTKGTDTKENNWKDHDLFTESITWTVKSLDKLKETLMEDTKYYTPSIEEFHVGFEYESKNNIIKEWTPKILEDGIVISVIRDKLAETETRVKYLDKEDIESLDFKWNDYHDSYVYRNYKIQKLSNNRIKIWDYFSKDGIVFIGVVKNKSELKRLLIQSQIIK